VLSVNTPNLEVFDLQNSAFVYGTFIWKFVYIFPAPPTLQFVITVSTSKNINVVHPNVNRLETGLLKC